VAFGDVFEAKEETCTQGENVSVLEVLVFIKEA
jgi:hypothetical protein